jgi:hypothetical protein
MIQAAPLVLSFARAVPMLNKLVGAVGITELGNRVNNYIEKNPEESAKIVSMIMPTQGIANALKNKSSEDVEEVQETEEVSTGSGVEERIREILREAGVEDADNQDLTDLPKDLEAKVMSGIAKSSTDRKKDMIEASAIIGLSGPGRERKKMIDEVAERYDEGGIEEITKPKYEGYKKFIRRRKADGGAIGIEVLFEEKKPRKNFFMGGPALEGPALGIYNSMKAYNSFTDQEIADAIRQAGYELPTADSGTTPDSSTPSVSANLGITDPQPYSTVDQREYNMDARNFGPGKKMEINPAALGMSFYDAEPKKSPEGFIEKTIDAFTSTPPRQLSQFTTPTGVSNLRGPAEYGFMTTDIEGLPGLNRDMIRSQYDNYSQFFGRPSNFADGRVKGKAGQVLGSLVGAASGIPFVGPGIEMFTNAFGPRGDKSLQSKYTVDGAGFGNTGARDEFGLATFNRKDGFLGLTGDTTRDYTDRMSQRLDELGNFFSSKGIDINDPDAYNKMKDINSTYAKQVLAYQQRTAVENLNKKQKDAVERQKQKAIEEAAKKQREAAATIAAAQKAQAEQKAREAATADRARAANPNVYAEADRRGFTDGRGGGFGSRSTGTNENFSNRTGRGRTGYGNGGLATMFTRRR